jgi:predicted dehydrogenase
MTLNVAIAGFGKMGKIRARTLRANANTRLIGIYEKNDALIDSDADKAIQVDSFAALLALKPDAIFVCAFNNVAAEYTIAALDAGIHVFCEKPPARDTTELAAVIAAEQRSSQVLKYGFNHRLHYSVMEAKRIIDSGTLGPLLWLRGIYGKAGSIDYGSNWRNFKQYSGGGILMDQGIHMLDLFRHLTGLEYNVVSSVLTNSYWHVEVEDNAFVTLQSGGVVATLHSSANQWKHKFLLEMHFAHGYLTLDGILSESRSYTPEMLISGRREFEDITFAMGKPAEQTTWYEYDNSWTFELNEFLAAIADAKPFNGTSHDAYQVLQLVEQIYKKSGFYGNSA